MTHFKALQSQEPLKPHNHTNEVEKVAQETGERAQRENPSLFMSAHLKFSKLMHLIECYCAHYGMRVSTFHALSELIAYWELEKRGVTIHELCVWRASKNNSSAGSYYTHYREVVERLLINGLLENVGVNKNKTKLYAPTVLALDSFGYIASQVA